MKSPPLEAVARTAVDNQDEVEWEPSEGGIYRDLHDRYILVLTADIDKLLVEFVDGTTRVIDIFEWRDLQPVIASQNGWWFQIDIG